MSELSTAAPSAPPSIAAAVAAALAPAPSPGELQTGVETVVAETQPIVTEPTAAPVEQTAPASPEGEQIEAAAEEAIEDLQLDLDRLPFEKPAEGEQPEQAQAAAQSDSENLIEAFGTKMPRAEAEKVVGAFLSTERGRRIYSTFKGMREISKPESEGGIGFEPTPEEIVRFHQAHLQHSRFWDDFSSDDPQRQEVLIRTLFATGPDGQRAAGADRLLGTLPTVLAQADPVMFRQLASPVALEITQACRSLAERAGDEDVKARWADAANLVAYLFELPTANGQGQAQQQESGEAAALRAELARIQGERQNAQQQTYQQAVRSLEGGFHKRMAMALEADVKEALKPIEGKADDVTYKSYMTTFRAQMGNKVRSYLQNETIQREFKQAVQYAAQNRDPRPLDALIRRVRGAYVASLNEDRQQYIRAVMQRSKQSADATATKLQQAQSKTEPAQGGSAMTATTASAAVPTRNANESAQDYLRRTTAALLRPS